VRQSNLFASVAEQFIAKYLKGKRTARTVGQLVRRELVARWGTTPITDIGRADVIAMVEEIAERPPIRP
jgi:hypothetical protein